MPVEVARNDRFRIFTNKFHDNFTFVSTTMRRKNKFSLVAKIQSLRNCSRKYFRLMSTWESAGSDSHGSMATCRGKINEFTEFSTTRQPSELLLQFLFFSGNVPLGTITAVSGNVPLVTI